MLHDDDKDDEPLSNRSALERADHRKKEKEMKKLEKQVQQTRMQKLKRDMLKKDVHGSVIIHKDADDKKTFGPKSHEDMAAAQFESAQEGGATAEELIAGEQEVEQIRKQSEEEQQSEPG